MLQVNGIKAHHDRVQTIINKTKNHFGQLERLGDLLSHLIVPAGELVYREFMLPRLYSTENFRLFYALSSFSDLQIMAAELQNIGKIVFDESGKRVWGKCIWYPTRVRPVSLLCAHSCSLRHAWFQ
jgi:hypothetical protein